MHLFKKVMLLERLERHDIFSYCLFENVLPLCMQTFTRGSTPMSYVNYFHCLMLKEIVQVDV